MIDPEIKAVAASTPKLRKLIRRAEQLGVSIRPLRPGSQAVLVTGAGGLRVVAASIHSLSPNDLIAVEAVDIECN